MVKPTDGAGRARALEASITVRCGATVLLSCSRSLAVQVLADLLNDQNYQKIPYSNITHWQSRCHSCSVVRSDHTGEKIELKALTSKKGRGHALDVGQFDEGQI